MNYYRTYFLSTIFFSILFITIILALFPHQDTNNLKVTILKKDITFANFTSTNHVCFWDNTQNTFADYSLNKFFIFDRIKFFDKYQKPTAVVWSSNDCLAAIALKQGNYLINFHTNETHPLSTDAVGVQWLPTDHTIVYQTVSPKNPYESTFFTMSFTDPQERALNTIDLSGYSETPGQILLSILPDNTLLYAAGPSDASPPTWWILKENQIAEERNIDQSWGTLEIINASPDGTQLLVAKGNDQDASGLWYYEVQDIQGKNIAKTNMNKKNSRCVWADDNQTLLCIIREQQKIGLWNYSPKDDTYTFLGNIPSIELTQIENMKHSKTKLYIIYNQTSAEQNLFSVTM